MMLPKKTNDGMIMEEEREGGIGRSLNKTN
jgi:hypothetical protein